MRVTLLAVLVGCEGHAHDGVDGTTDPSGTRTSTMSGDTGHSEPDVGPGPGTGGDDERCLVLYGQLDRVRGPDEGLPTGHTGRTLQAWIRTYNPAEQIAVSYGRPSPGQGIQLGTSSGYPILRVGSGSSEIVTGDVFVGDDAWHHLVAAWDGTTAVLLVDGEVAGTGQISGETLQGDLIAGNTPTGDQTKPWIGWLDDVKIVLGPRTPQEIESDPEALDIDPEDLLLWWDFEVTGENGDIAEGLQIPVPDLSGHGHDAVTAGLSSDRPKFLPCR